MASHGTELLQTKSIPHWCKWKITITLKASTVCIYIIPLSCVNGFHGFFRIGKTHKPKAPADSFIGSHNFSRSYSPATTETLSWISSTLSWMFLQYRFKTWINWQIYKLIYVQIYIMPKHTSSYIQSDCIFFITFWELSLYWSCNIRLRSAFFWALATYKVFDPAWHYKLSVRSTLGKGDTVIDGL